MCVYHIVVCLQYMTYYLQVRANPPIRLAEWSGDKNLYCTANITTVRLVCFMSHAKFA